MAAARGPSAWERRLRPLYEHLDEHRFDQAVKEANKLLKKDPIPIVKARARVERLERREERKREKRKREDERRIRERKE